MRGVASRIAVFAALAPALAFADAAGDRFNAGGYFRIMTRPDFEGGNSKLGYWNLSGRLLNEGPWAALELGLDVLQAQPGANDVWAAVHAKLEGGSFKNTDPGNGSLTQFGLSQLYVKAGNVLLDRVTWQLGTLESYFGDLGLYDMRPAAVFSDTVGISARYQLDRVDLLLGIGDSGYALRGAAYNTLLTAGGTLRVRVNEHLEFGGGGQFAYEPQVMGNRNAPYYTPGVTYEDVRRREVVKHFLEANPGQEDLFPKPVAASASSYKAIGYLGFGKLGPLRWSNLFVSYRKLHPDNSYVENYLGRDYTIYLSQVTDKRTQLLAGNEMQFTVVPDRLDAAWAVLYGQDVNLDNTVAPGDDNRTYYSTVLRLPVPVADGAPVGRVEPGAREVDAGAAVPRARGLGVRELGRHAGQPRPRAGRHRHAQHLAGEGRGGAEPDGPGHLHAAVAAADVRVAVLEPAGGLRQRLRRQP